MAFVRFLLLIFILIIAFVIYFYILDKFMKDSMFETKAAVAIIIFALFFFIGIMAIQYV